MRREGMIPQGLAVVWRECMCMCVCVCVYLERVSGSSCMEWHMALNWDTKKS